jgi:hypothetical protein
MSGLGSGSWVIRGLGDRSFVYVTTANLQLSGHPTIHLQKYESNMSVIISQIHLTLLQEYPLYSFSVVCCDPSHDPNLILTLVILFSYFVPNWISTFITNSSCMYANQ